MLGVNLPKQAIAKRGRRRRPLGDVRERGGGGPEAFELLGALLAAREVLLELAPLGVVECIQGVRRYEIVEEFLLHVT